MSVSVSSCSFSVPVCWGMIFQGYRLLKIELCWLIRISIWCIYFDNGFWCVIYFAFNLLWSVLYPKKEMTRRLQLSFRFLLQHNRSLGKSFFSFSQPRFTNDKLYVTRKIQRIDKPDYSSCINLRNQEGGKFFWIQNLQIKSWILDGKIPHAKKN